MDANLEEWVIWFSVCFKIKKFYTFLGIVIVLLLSDLLISFLHVSVTSAAAALVLLQDVLLELDG